MKTNLLEIANNVAGYINANGSIPQEGFRPEYTARVWAKDGKVRIYIRNGGKDCGSLSVEPGGQITDKYAKLGTFGAELVENAKSIFC